MMRVMAIAIIVLGCAYWGMAADDSVPPSSPPATQPASPLAKELTLDLGNGVTMQFVLIPAGKFTMGSNEPVTEEWRKEAPAHEVTISTPFYMSIYEVTEAQYAQVTGIRPPSTGGERRSRNGVSWYNALDFCEQLTARMGRMALLPSEAQWEYAARAGSTTRFTFGDDPAQLNDYAWTRQNTVDAQGKLIAPNLRIREAGKRKPNAWGLYDMYGNVWEWCSDWYGDYDGKPVADPAGPDSGERRVIRGGSYFYGADRCNSTARHAYYPATSVPGIRVIVLPE